MKKQLFAAVLALLIAVGEYVRESHVSATSPMNCNLSAYQGASGLNAAVNGDSLVLTWNGDRNQELRLRFVVDNGTPTIAELAARRKGAAWGTLATNVTPEFRVASGRRRMDGEAREALEENGIKEILITSYSVQGNGNQRKLVADVEWTFPLDFVEVVWGDGQRTDRQVISTTETTGFGQRHFEIPFEASAKEVGALCRLGHRGQWRAGAADQAEYDTGVDAIRVAGRNRAG